MKDEFGNDIIVTEKINADGTKSIVTEKIDKNGNKIVIEEKIDKSGKKTVVYIHFSYFKFTFHHKFSEKRDFPLFSSHFS